MSNLKPCLIGMEACGSAHYWARVFQKMGHTVKLMAPQFVKPYIKSNKNDKNDAAGIAEAVTRPDMKFVPIKTIEQQDILLLHRGRELIIKQRVAQVNQIRGLLSEYGIVIPQGIEQIGKLLLILDEHVEKLTASSRKFFERLYEQYKQISSDLEAYDKDVERIAKENVMCREIIKIPGIGPITASAIVGTIGDAKVFKNGREVSAWLGLVPKQHSSGGKTKLLGISKRGDIYVRKLLIQGARSVVKICERKTDCRNQWIASKKKQCGFNKASVALANKNARIIWAMLFTGECYRQEIA